MTFVTEQKGRKDRKGRKGRKGLRGQLVLMDKMVLTEPMVHKGQQVLMAHLVSLAPRGRTDKRERGELLASTESGAKVLGLVEWDREDLLASLLWDLAVSNTPLSQTMQH